MLRVFFSFSVRAIECVVRYIFVDFRKGCLFAACELKGINARMAGLFRAR